jgi:murein DD-endopeptidase MepM/ murein hydrolase activator NlpD
VKFALPVSSLAHRGFVPLLFLLCWRALPASAQSFQLPTANHALFETIGGESFFVGTVGKPWTTGMFGCVRSDGWQMHEGLDIKCLQRDRRGEPIDPVMASADGTVAYFNTKTALSTYGKYIVLRHRVDGIEVYTLYAHLGEVRGDLRPGQSVKAGESIATMGRTTNTREGISKERAHVHFEIDLFVNERFSDWLQQTFPGTRNDHGEWNGRNLLGLDPRLVLLAQHEQGPKFSLLHFIRNQAELCRVVIRDTNFPWLRRYTPLIKRNAVAEREGVAGYEIALNYNGVPYQLIPRAGSELTSQSRVHLLSVNEAEQQSHPCRKLVIKRGANWQLTSAGQHLIDLLTD